jgi:hypothetical protein
MGNVEEFVATAQATDDDFIVVHPRLGVEVYPNKNGQIVVKNIGDPYRDDDESFIVIEVEDAKRIADAIVAMARDVKSRAPF